MHGASTSLETGCCPLSGSAQHFPNLARPDTMRFAGLLVWLFVAVCVGGAEEKEGGGQCRGGSVGAEGAEASSSCGCGALDRNAFASEKRETGKEKYFNQHNEQAQAMDGGETSDVAQLIHLEGGTFFMGSDQGFFPMDGEGPARQASSLCVCFVWVCGCVLSEGVKE